jgi:hypothetical protein
VYCSYRCPRGSVIGNSVCYYCRSAIGSRSSATLCLTCCQLVCLDSSTLVDRFFGTTAICLTSTITLFSRVYNPLPCACSLALEPDLFSVLWSLCYLFIGPVSLCPIPFCSTCSLLCVPRYHLAHLSSYLSYLVCNVSFCLSLYSVSLSITSLTARPPVIARPELSF